MRRPLLVLAAAALLLPGCFMGRSTTNAPLAPEALAHLLPGRSTTADVVQVLGAPAEVVQLGRRSAYRFDYTLAKRTGLWLVVVGFYNNDQHSDRVWAFFDEHDVLTHVASSFQTHLTRYRMPWKEDEDTTP